MSDAMVSGARLLRASRILLGTNGAVWVALGVIWLVWQAGGPSTAPQGALLVALMFGNAAILITLAFRLRTTSVWLPRMALLWVGVNLILSFTDEVGPADLVVGILNAVTLFLLAAFWRARGRTSQ
jgi:hypothetical protein